MSPFRGYVVLCRLSNLPTCASNVLVGCAIASPQTPMPWPAAGLVAVAVMLLYVGGVALNDVVDLEVDQRERPGRPLPSGVVSLAGVHRFIWICMTLGLGIFALMGPAAFVAALVLAVTIVLYDVLHQRTAWSIVLMGLCRSLVYVTAALAVAGWPPGAGEGRTLAVLAGGLGLYIVGLSVVARHEAATAPARRLPLALTLPVIALLPLLVVRPGGWGLPAAAAVTLVAWLAFTIRPLLATPPRIGPAVQGWLAAICLVDGLYLILLDRPGAAIVAAACFALTLLGHRVVPGT